MSSRPSIVQWGPHECGPHCQQGAGVSALVWCGNTFTNNNAVWCWCFPTGSAEPGNSLFHSAALTPIWNLHSRTRFWASVFHRGVPPIPLLCFLFCTEEEKLLSLCTTQIWTLQMSDAAGLTFACKILQNAPWGNAATRPDDAGSPRVTTRKEQIGLYVPPKSLLVNWIDLWKLCGDSQTIPAQ